MGQGQSDVLNVEQKATLEAAGWKGTTFIKPHEYVLHHVYPDVYRIVQKAIQEHGYVREFQGRPYRYVDIGDHTYWIVEKVVNRTARIDGEGPD
jgi:hypothetical protein